MTPTLIGYFPKRTLKHPEGFNAAHVEEVCSVSNCISEDPDGWIDLWKHNEMWVFDSPELALSIVPEAVRAQFDLYAYKLFPIIFTKGEQQPFEIPQLQVQPLPVSFERLGIDVVSREYSSFEHSPLSCNYMAEHVATNRYCLIDDEDTAFRVAGEFEAGGCEPGPYVVVEVWRQRHAG